MSIKQLPNSMELRGLGCAACGLEDTCSIVPISFSSKQRGLFVAICTSCRHTTQALRKTQDLLAMFAFGEAPSETGKVA